MADPLQPLGPDTDDTDTAPPVVPRTGGGDPLQPLDKPILSTSFTSNGAGGKAPVPWGVREHVEDFIKGDRSVSNPSIGPLTVPGLGMGGGPDAGFWSRVGSNATNPKALAILGQMLVSRDPKELEAVIKSRVPNAVFTTDDKGNRIVQVPGNPPMYLDRPGAMTPAKSAFYAPQVAASILAPGRTIPGMIASNATQDVANTGASYLLGGAESPIDQGALATGGVLTGGLGLAGRGISQGVRAGADWLTGNVSPVLQDVRAATRRLLAKEFGQTPTLGQVTGNPFQIKKEDILLNAKASEVQASRLADLHRWNEEATKAAKTGLIAEVSGVGPWKPGTRLPATFTGDEAMFGNKMLGDVRAKYEALSDAERAAWDKLGGGKVSPDTDAGRAVGWTPDVSADILGRSFQTVRDRVGLPAGAGGKFSEGQLRNGAQQVVDALDVMRAHTMSDTGTKAFNLGHYQDMRQQLQNIIDNAPTPSVASAVREMRRNLDDAIAAAEATPGRMTGDAQKLTEFREANKATRKKYGYLAPRDNDAAADFMEQATRKTNNRYALTGQEAVDHALGKGGVVDPGGGTLDVLRHFQTHGNEEALNASRGVVVKRPMYGRANSPDAPDAEVMGGPRYGSTAKQINSQLRGPGKEVTEMLLDPAQQARLRRFKDAIETLSRSYTPQGPRQNTSGSGYLFQGAGDLPLPNFLKDAITRFGAKHSINAAILGGQRRVMAIPAGEALPAGVGATARTGGLIGEEYVR